MDVRARLIETIQARQLCFRTGDLDGVAVLTAEIDGLLDLMPQPRLPSDQDGHTAPR